MLAKAMGANKLIGVEMNDYRIKLAKDLGLVDVVIKPGENALDEILAATGGMGAERAFDCSASDAGRRLPSAARGSGGKSPLWAKGIPAPLTRARISSTGRRPSTVPGLLPCGGWKSWWNALVRWGIHPDQLITNEFPLEKAGEAPTP